MEFILLDFLQKKKYYEDILHMMELSDGDFVPPLSQRSSTTQKTLSGEESGSVSAYLDEMLNQPVLGAFESEKLLGFISFKENYTTEGITEADLPNIYLSTLVLHPEARGKGLTKKLYTHLFNTIYPDRSIFTRTWSTNMAHIKILSFFNFEEIKRLPNHRGAGIDTVYYAKRRV